MEQRSRILIIAMVSLVVLGIAAIIVAVSLSSQPPLPSTNNNVNTPPVTNTPPANTPTTQNPNTGAGGENPVSTPVVNPAPTKPADEDVIPMTGGVAVGKVVNLCGVDAKSTGIGMTTKSSCLDRCFNVDGVGGYCDPDVGESIYVTTCTGKVNISHECTTSGGGVIATSALKTMTTFEDYLQGSCSVQINVYDMGQSPFSGAQPIDYIVFQKNDCAVTGQDGQNGGDADGEGTDTDPDSLPTSNPCVDGDCVGELPSTALFSKEVDLAIMGLILLIIGVIVYRTNLHVELFYLFGGGHITAEFSETERAKLNQQLVEIAKQKRASQAMKAKNTREGFEKSFE